MDKIQKVLINAGRKDLAQKYYQKVSTTASELQRAVEKAQDEFWDSIAKSFPHIKSGDQDPSTANRFEMECKKVVQQWLEDNAPVK